MSGSSIADRISERGHTLLRIFMIPSVEALLSPMIFSGERECVLPRRHAI
jgi:hypothetical protein